MGRPGVGAAEDAMGRLRAAGLTTVIPQLTQPVLGVCIGMQLLFTSSEESRDGGLCDCLGILPGTVARLPGTPALPVPHMGWNRRADRAADPLFDGLGAEEYFYFVHSYAAPVGDYTLASARYGLTLSIPLADSVSLKLAWSTGLITRGGADFDTFGLILQYRWFDR